MSLSTGQDDDHADTAVRLSRDVILSAGMEIASRQGSTAVTVRDLGLALGVDHTAIYRYFRNKESLMTALVERLISTVAERTIPNPDDWFGTLVSMSDNFLAGYLEYPTIAANSYILTTTGDAELNGIELIISNLERAGLEGDELLRYYQLFSSHMLTYASIIAQTRLTSGSDADADADDLYIPEAIRVTASGQPAASKYREQLLEMRDQDVYRTGIRLILENAAAAGAAAVARRENR